MADLKNIDNITKPDGDPFFGGVGMSFSGAQISIDSGSAQTIENNIAEEIVWLTDDYDYGGWIDNSTNKRLQIPTGVTKVVFSASVSVTAITNGRIDLRLYEETRGLVFLHAREYNNIAGNEPFVTTFPMIEVVDGEVFYLEILQSGGVTETLPAAGNNDPNTFSVRAIEAIAPSVTPRGALVRPIANLTGQNITTRVAVVFDQEIYDTDDIHDNSVNNTRLTVPSGVTHIRLTGQLAIFNNNADTWIVLAIEKNGSVIAGDGGFFQRSEVGGSTTSAMGASTAILEVVAGDYFEMMAGVESDTSVDIQNASWFAMEIVTQAVVAMPAFRGASVMLVSDLTGQDVSSEVLIPFDDEDYDTDNIHDNSVNPSRLTVPAGITRVRLLGQGGLTLVDAGEYTQLQILKNGAGLDPLVFARSEIGVDGTAMIIQAPVLRVIAGDYFELGIKAEADISATIPENRCWFAMEIIE